MKKRFNDLKNNKTFKCFIALLAGFLIFLICIYLTNTIEVCYNYNTFLMFLSTFLLTGAVNGFVAFHLFNRTVLKTKGIILPNDKTFLKSFVPLLAGFIIFLLCIYLANIIETSFKYPIFLTILLTGIGIIAFYLFNRVVLKPKRKTFQINIIFLKFFLALLSGLFSFLLSIYIMNTLNGDYYYPVYMMFILTANGTIVFYCFNSMVLKSKSILFPTLLFSPLLFFTLIFLPLAFKDTLKQQVRRALERMESSREYAVQVKKTYTGDTLAIKAFYEVYRRNILENLQWVNGRITSVSVDSKSIDTIPPCIGILDSLIYLSFSENHIKTVPAEIGRLTHLERLYLRNNCITAIPGKLGNLSNLTVLDLSTNHLSQLSPQIGNLSNLKILDLRNNSLKSIPREIGLLKNLEILDLSYNRLDSLPVEIIQCTRLKRLYLNNNKMKTLPSEIVTLSNTCSLHVNNNLLCRKNLQTAVIQWLEARNIEWEEPSGQK